MVNHELGDLRMNEERIDFRVTLWFDDDMEISFNDWVEACSNFEEGSWAAPFPNEPGNSYAYGLIEAYAQSDSYAGLFYERDVIKVRVFKR